MGDSNAIGGERLGSRCRIGGAWSWHRRLAKIAAAALLLLAASACSSIAVDAERPPARASNVILMINDGAGWGAWDAAAYWQYGSREGAPYADFPVRYGVATFPLTTANAPTGVSTATVGYDPGRAWDTGPTAEPALPFAGYRYLARTPTDSAAAGTAMASGVKTYNNAINHDNHGRPVAFATLTARAVGKATGVVTSVPFSHATPAAFGAQNASREAYHAIARQMLSQGHLDLIMGTGLPGYNVNGTPCERLADGESAMGRDDPDEFVSAEDAAALAAGRLVPAGSAQAWRVIRDKAEFEAVAEGRPGHAGPLLGSPRIAKTLQQTRQARFTGQDPGNPSGDAYVATVPTLATMARGALRHLSAQSGDGLFLMIEGGATDWAAHTSHCGTQWSYGPCPPEPEYGRLIEETLDFNDAVAAVVEWIEANGGWERTLLIVTTDHDNSMPMGPDAQAQPYQPVVNHGRGRMPGISFRPTGDHSNALVPLWAKGAGAERFATRVRGVDPGYAAHVGLNDGAFIDNTDIAVVIEGVLRGTRTPPPE